MYRKHLAGCFSAFICLAVSCFAQNARVSGQVQDTQHANIAASSVILTNAETKVMVENKTDATGSFILPPVDPGHYEIRATAPGFAPTVLTGITLEVGESKVITIILRPGTTESVEVNTAPPELTTDRADRSLTIEPTFVEKIPLNIRNPLQLISDAPGVTKGDDGLSGQNYTSESRTNTFRINGAKGSTTDTLIDGAANTTSYYNQDGGIPGVDSVQETRVFTDAYAPEYGRTSGGVVAYSLRSGTSQLHGSVFEFYRNENMDANGFNANANQTPRGSFGRNQFGFRVGGPVILPHVYSGRNKTFFFFSYDGLRDTTAGSFTGTVPTALERKGDFSQTFDAKGNLIVIYDPSTSTSNANGSNFTRTPLPGNKIANPNAIGLALLNLYPMPNHPGAGASNMNNFFSNAPSTDDNNSYDTRIDHQFNDKHSVFGHYTNFTNRIHYNDPFGNGLSPEDADDRIPGKNIDIDHTWVINPSLVFEHHFSWAHSESNRDEAVLKSPASLGFGGTVTPGVTANLTPQLSLSGATATGSESTLGNYYPLERNYSSVWQYAADTTWVKNKHIFKFGVDLRRYPTQLWDPENGDREIDMVLTAIERAEAKNPRPDARWRIEHASVMNQALLDRAKKDGVILVFHSYMWEYGDILQSYGPDRLAMMHAYRTALDMGIPVAGHSDSPISAADPLLRIQDMVTRTSSHGLVVGPQQRVTVDEAIKVWTLDGAYATYEEKIKGSITPGKLADFVVLAKDPRRVPPNTIKDIRLEATYMGGEKVYTAPPNAVAMIPQPPINYGDGNYGDGDEEENQTPQ